MNVFQRQVVLVRAVVAAPADVEPDAVLRDVAQGVVQRVDAHLGVLVVVGSAHLREHLPAVAQVRVVDLEDEAGIDDRLVLLRHGVSDGVHELLVRLVVLVRHPVLDRPRRHRGQERLFVLLPASAV